MTTSALELQTVLAHVAKASNDRRFLDAVSDYYGFRDEYSDIQSARTIISLIRNIGQQVEALPHDEEIKKQIRLHLRPFSSVSNFSHIHHDIKTAKNSFLKHEH